MTTFRLDVRQIGVAADALDRLTGEALGGAALESVNAVTVRAERSIIEGGTAGINLTQAYVRSKTDLSLAVNPARPRAEILTRGDLTPLGRFEPLAIVRAPGAQRRAGAIAGRRNAGAIVSIRRGGTVKEDQWFQLPLRRGDIPGGNGVGVFVRSSRLKPSPTATREGRFGKQQIYGPSPYQLARKQIEVQGDGISRDLVDTTSERLLDEVKKAGL